MWWYYGTIYRHTSYIYILRILYMHSVAWPLCSTAAARTPGHNPAHPDPAVKEQQHGVVSTSIHEWRWSASLEISGLAVAALAAAPAAAVLVICDRLHWWSLSAPNTCLSMATRPGALLSTTKTRPRSEPVIGHCRPRKRGTVLVNGHYRPQQSGNIAYRYIFSEGNTF